MKHIKGRIIRCIKSIKEKCIKLIFGKIYWWKTQGLVYGKNLQIGGVSFGAEAYLVTIGNNVLISSNVQFLTHDGSVHTIRANKLLSEEIQKYGRIEVGDNTFIGANTIILPGVFIGKNCIIGAGSIVTKSVPDNSVIAGVPARIISSLEEYAKKVLQRAPKNWNDKDFKLNMKEYLLNILPQPSTPSITNA